jgi:hypothetical protein
VTFWAFADAHPMAATTLVVFALWALTETVETIADAIKRRR